jgi:hypothetical protein
MPPFYTVAFEGVMAVRPAGNLVSPESATEAFTSAHSLTWTPATNCMAAVQYGFRRAPGCLA